MSSEDEDEVVGKIIEFLIEYSKSEVFPLPISLNSTEQILF